MKKLEALVNQAMISAGGYPPSLQISVSQNGRVIYENSFGERRYKYYDVASLTKIMVTVPLIVKLVDSGNLDLNKKVSYYLGYFKGYEVGEIQIWRLLAHISGLVWWRPYFEKLNKFSLSMRSTELKKIFRCEKVSAPRKCIYSDPDFFILGWLIEELFGAPLDSLAQEHIFSRLKLENTFYLRQNSATSQLLKKSKISDFAPTEKIGARIIQGVVHDDNARALGGVSGHAGVFSNLSDVAKFGEWLAAAKIGRFTARAVKKAQGDWALGFMIPSRPLSSAGQLVSQNAFGHTGFTGTSLWIDQKRSVVVTVLSNRTFPTRKDERFLELRRQIHDAIWEDLD